MKQLVGFLTNVNKPSSILILRRLESSSSFGELLSLVDRVEKNKTSAKKASHSRCSSSPLIRIVSNGYSGSPKSFLFICNGVGNNGEQLEQKFLVNCGEGTSRILTDMGELGNNNNGKNLNIVLTRSTWNGCFSGLFGIVYSLTSTTISASKSPSSSSICFHSPFDTPRFLYDTYHLLKLQRIRFERHEYRGGQNFFHTNKNDLQIRALSVRNVYVYLFTFVADKRQRRLLVLDLPDREHLDEFARRYTELLDPISHIDVFAHMSPSEVFSSREYIQIIDRLIHRRRDDDDDVEHLIFDENRPNMVSKNIYLQQTFLNQLDSYVFPLLPTRPFKSHTKKYIF